MTDHLLVKRRKRSNEHADIERVHDEVATCVDQSPDVQVAWRVEALLVAEHSLPVLAYKEHCKHSTGAADPGVDGADDICAVFSLLGAIKLLITIVTTTV